MTLNESNQTVAEVQSVRDRSLEEAYEVHDVGYEICTRKLNRHGFTVEDHGDDERHADEILYGDGPDLAVYHDDELVAYMEIKTKESQEWFGRCNKRHFTEYVAFTDAVDVPVYIWFGLVDADTGICKRDAFIEVTDTDQVTGSVTMDTETEYVFLKSAIEHVDSTTNDELLKVSHGDIENIKRGDMIVDTIPNVHGNTVVCLDENQFRSVPYVLSQLQ